MQRPWRSSSVRSWCPVHDGPGRCHPPAGFAARAPRPLQRADCGSGRQDGDPATAEESLQPAQRGGPLAAHALDVRRRRAPPRRRSASAGGARPLARAARSAVASTGPSPATASRQPTWSHGCQSTTSSRVARRPVTHWDVVPTPRRPPGDDSVISSGPSHSVRRAGVVRCAQTVAGSAAMVASRSRTLGASPRSGAGPPSRAASAPRGRARARGRCRGAR